MTAALAAPLAVFIEQRWTPVLLTDLSLEYNLSDAAARMVYADVVLNGLVKKLDSLLLMLTGKNRGAALYTMYFGAQRPFEVAAGILGPQLETMRGWVPLLKAASEPVLNTLGDEIKAAVDAADAAVSAKMAAENALLMFKATGDRAKMVADYNALRKGTYGELGKIKHQHPELPNDFADSFFRHEGKRAEDKLSVEQLQAKIESLAGQQAVLEKKRQALLDKQKAEADAKVALEQQQAAIEAKKKEMEELGATIKKMEDALGK